MLIVLALTTTIIELTRINMFFWELDTNVKYDMNAVYVSSGPPPPTPHNVPAMPHRQPSSLKCRVSSAAC